MAGFADRSGKDGVGVLFGFYGCEAGGICCVRVALAVRMVCGLCQGESGSGASLGAPVAKSDRRLRLPAAGEVFRGETLLCTPPGLTRWC
jgi:hypothetical protein